VGALPAPDAHVNTRLIFSRTSDPAIFSSLLFSLQINPIFSLAESPIASNKPTPFGYCHEFDKKSLERSDSIRDIRQLHPTKKKKFSFSGFFI
jgi:hypothetical protein